MPTLRRIIPLLALLPLACTSSPGTTSDASTDAGSTTTPEAPSSSTHETHETHETHHEDPHETHEPTSSTTHEHTSSTTHEHTSSTTHEHTSSTGHDTHGETATTGELTAIEAYCNCMLERCHDQYHATWGEDHEGSLAMCAAAAAAVPSVGMPATMGDSLECRQHHCDLGEDEPGACDSALGGGACE